MTTERLDAYDVVVLGGGPAGSTLAALVAMKRHRVLLLEREFFPRHQIGESLLPATVHGIIPLLGLRTEVEQAGFVKKLGGTFLWGKNPIPWTFAFGSSPLMAGQAHYAYQVERSRFDHMLLNNARRRGVDVQEGCAAKEVVFTDGRASAVRYTNAAGEERVAAARFVFDTTGNQSTVYEKVANRVYSKFFQNIALYTYFDGAKRLPPPNDGNILCAAFGGGWFWYIPLSPTLTSVGAVVARTEADKLKAGHEEAFFGFVDQCPIIKEYLASGTRVTDGQYGQFRVRKDYSYCCDRFWVPGMALVGDAACFVDPVFSSGVHLATYSALLAARSVNTSLGGEISEERCFAEFERRYRREFGNFYQFLLAFYDMNQDEDSYFWAARKVTKTEEAGNEAFIRLVAGVSAGDEDWMGGQSFLSSRGALKDVLLMASGSSPGATRPDTADGFDAATFMKGFTSEILQVQSQARLGARRAPEAPLFDGGLIPSKDGLAWQESPT